jgi:hypothetical protein
MNELEKTLKRIEDTYSAYENELEAGGDDGILDISVLCSLADSVPYLIETIREQRKIIEEKETK